MAPVVKIYAFSRSDWNNMQGIWPGQGAWRCL